MTPPTPQDFGRRLALDSLPDGIPNGDMQAICEAAFGSMHPDSNLAINAYRATMRMAVA